MHAAEDTQYLIGDSGSRCVQRVPESAMNYGPTEVGSLRLIFQLAMGALAHTRHVNVDVGPHLADAVFETYIDFGCPNLPLSDADIEELAVESLGRLLQGFGCCLAQRY